MKAPTMNHHSIRVHMPFGEPHHYHQLRESLQRFGIQSVLRQQDGQSFKLPLGEFYLHSSQESEQIRELVYEIASQISKAAVIVTSGTNVAWVGLETAS